MLDSSSFTDNFSSANPALILSPRVFSDGNKAYMRIVQQIADNTTVTEQPIVYADLLQERLDAMSELNTQMVKPFSMIFGYVDALLAELNGMMILDSDAGENVFGAKIDAKTQSVIREGDQMPSLDIEYRKEVLNVLRSLPQIQNFSPRAAQTFSVIGLNTPFSVYGYAQSPEASSKGIANGSHNAYLGYVSLFKPTAKSGIKD